jgi:hypothetical protein
MAAGLARRHWRHLVKRHAARFGAFLVVALLALFGTVTPAGATETGALATAGLNPPRCAYPSSAAEGASVVLAATCTGSALQTWVITPDPIITWAPVYEVQNSSTGKCLAAQTMGTTSPVVDSTCARVNGQIWEFFPYNGEEWYIIDYSTGHCLGRQGLTNLQVSACVTGSPSQLWFTPL